MNDRLPKYFTEFEGEELMSNFDGEINKDTEKSIKGKNLFSTYSAGIFHGIVWNKGDKWLCEIWRCGSHIKTFICDTTEEIMREARSEFGYE